MSNFLLTAALPPTTEDHRSIRARLRPMVRADAEAIAQVYHASYDGEWTVSEGLEDVERAFDGGYGELLPAASLIALDEQGAVLGAIMTVLNPPWDDAPRGPFIIDVFVAPASRGSGVGRALVLAAMHASPGSSISLRVEADNAVALNLYRGLRFEPV